MKSRSDGNLLLLITWGKFPGEPGNTCTSTSTVVATGVLYEYIPTTGGRADVQTTCRQPAAPYQHHMTCPEFSDTLDITKGTRHEQASIRTYLCVCLCMPTPDGCSRYRAAHGEDICGRVYISTLAGAPFQARKANYLIGVFVCLLKLVEARR